MTMVADRDDGRRLDGFYPIPRSRVQKDAFLDDLLRLESEYAQGAMSKEEFAERKATLIRNFEGG